jgi:uncharacterized membrane protein YdcZ (DUF606 family)
MNIFKILGIVLLAAGVLCLVYKGFNYTKETHEGNVGPITFSMKEKDHVTIPTWAGILMVVGGAGLLLVPGKKR